MFVRGMIALTLLWLGSPALAWNNQGHMATGAIAFDTLSRRDPAALTTIATIMQSHPDRARFDRTLGTLAGPARLRLEFELMARWPDDIRKTSYDHPEWHYAVKVVSGAVYLMPLTFGDAITQFHAQLAIARDPKASAAARAVALCWVFHIVGDMHQPLHAGHRMSWRFLATDRSGTIAFVRTAPGSQPIQLHEYWDSSADRPGSETEAAGALAARAELLSVAVGKDFDAWVEESRGLSASTAYRGAALDSTRAPADAPALSPAYQADARALSERRIDQAGIRLAGLLTALPPTR